MRLVIAVLCMSVLCHPCAAPAQAPKAFFLNATDHGVVGDRVTLNTDAIRRLIDTAEQRGGGTIYFPPGDYLTGPLDLCSNLVIYLDAGATLWFSDDFDHYLPWVKGRWEGTECMIFHPLLRAENAENITLTGRGTIDGQGQAWWDFFRPLKLKERQGIIDHSPAIVQACKAANKDTLGPGMYQYESYFLRPPMIQFLSCRNVRIEGISLRNSPFWTVNPVYCDNLTVDGITITNPGDSPNTDGVNPDSCTNVHISNCHIDVGDDCITIKSGRDRDGRRVNKPCENLTITNCTMLRGHGGVVIGSEMSGGVRNVTISNCIFDGTDKGIRMKTMRGRGGEVRDIRVSNIVMRDIRQSPLQFNMRYKKTDPEPVSERTPAFRNIHISNVTVTRALRAGLIKGIEERAVENVVFADIDIQAETGFECEDARGIVFRNVTVSTEEGPAFMFKNSADIEIRACKTHVPATEDAIVKVDSTRDVFIHACQSLTEGPAFVSLHGAQTHGITLKANRLTGPGGAVLKMPEVSDSAVTITE